MTKGVQGLGRVAVLMGGCSAERAVSLKSGQAVLDSLHRSGVDAIGIDFKGDIQSIIQELPLDRIHEKIIATEQHIYLMEMHHFQ